MRSLARGRRAEWGRLVIIRTASVETTSAGLSVRPHPIVRFRLLLLRLGNRYRYVGFRAVRMLLGLLGSGTRSKSTKPASASQSRYSFSV